MAEEPIFKRNSVFIFHLIPCPILGVHFSLGSVTKPQHQSWQTEKPPPGDYNFWLMALVSQSREGFDFMRSTKDQMESSQSAKEVPYLSVDLEGAGALIQFNVVDTLNLAGILDVGSVGANGQSHQVFFDGELLCTVGAGATQLGELVKLLSLIKIAFDCQTTCLLFHHYICIGGSLVECSPEGEEFIQNLGTRAEEARQIARHHIFKAQETNKTNYDARHTGKIYNPGDLVWIFIPIRRVGFSEKLLRRYFGPFRVTKKISDVTYEVEAVCEQGRRQKKRDTVHILRMKPYYDPSRQEDSSSGYRYKNYLFVSPLGKCLLRVGINDFQRTAEFLVLPSCSHDVILGWDFLESSSAIIDCAQSEISFSEMPNEDPSVARLYLASDDIIPPKSIKRVVARTPNVAGIKNCVIEGSRKLLLEKELFIPFSYVTIWHGQANIWVTNFSKNQIPIPSGICLAQFIKIQPQEVCPIVEANENYVSEGVELTYKMSKFEDSIENLTNIDNAERPVGRENISSCISPELPQSHKIELLELLERFSELFNPITKSPSELITKHKITTGDARPLKRRPYRVSPSERKIIQEEVDKMMDIGVVQPSESPWASPVVLVRKRDGSVRFCVDYRGLNKVTKKDVYPLPRVDDALDCLKGAKIYSTMDLKSGYWQISVDEADREKTAFITPDGLFEFKVMPFGLCNAPATFERMMDGLLKGLRWTICLCYLDDVVVFADNFSDHLTRIEAVLNCFKKVGLRLNPSKCSFGASKIKILGHQVDQNGIRPDEEKIKAITEFPAPNNLQQVRSFLGLSSYYRRFIRNYADIARPLNALLSKGTKFEWNTAQEEAFRKLKIALTSKPALGHFDDDASTELHTDASGYGIGAVLAQKQGSDEKVIAYASRTLLRAEQNYSTTERECLAIIWAIGKFRPYLFGRHFRVPIPPPGGPFQKVGIDLLGRFPISQGKKKWIVVCTDYLTKYAVTQSLGSGEAQEIAKFLLEEVILKHGAPREIVMDRGRNFQSKLLQELTNKCGIKKKTTTAYHPQTNGLTERLNRTIADMLSMYMDLDQKNWDEMLPFITFAYNTAKQESTGFTPFFLIHGREAETTLDTIFPYSSSPEGEEFIQNLGTRAEEARQIARHHIFKAQETNKTNYDARHTGKIYNPGDLVWIFIPIRRVGFSEKLLRRYFGPFRVTKKISDVTYEVEAVCEQGRRQKKRDTVHILRMKPYYDPSRQEDSSSVDNSTSGEEEELR
ncbi:hypothetical protein LAZ67_9003197 [Cordylochernes scorpioides]|uniref:Endonuclease n=1 Tax=Cordylochernes scorpioides TaxID=51811 RepID=A0ABY6KWD5_9ARAC|nr:hypothetical protein LAZ67_9003197 [Cordylochernes scorpioides]